MIHLIVGNTGSGKTTYATALKDKTSGIVFSIDKWNKTLFFPDKRKEDGLHWILERIDRVESLIMNQILQLESLDIDSILDLGFAKHDHREKFRCFAIENNLSIILHFLDVDKTIRNKRINKRNRDQGDTYEFEVTDDNFEFMESWFEQPTEDELIDAAISY